VTKTTLIVVDVQRDFCEGGALAAADTFSLLEPLGKFIAEARRKGAIIVYTRDWHPQEHSSFRQNGGPWPIHCVAGSAGAQLTAPLKAEANDVVVNKGTAVEGAGYSGFEDTGLANQLKAMQVKHVAVSGIATEYCVRATALDAVKSGFETVVLRDLIRAVKPEETVAIIKELEKAGVKSETAAEWMKSWPQQHRL
jgi:nicotinamidase/pyrazinamidase